MTNSCARAPVGSFSGMESNAFGSAARNGKINPGRDGPLCDPGQLCISSSTQPISIAGQLTCGWLSSISKAPAPLPKKFPCPCAFSSSTPSPAPTARSSALSPAGEGSNGPAEVGELCWYWAVVLDWPPPLMVVLAEGGCGVGLVEGRGMSGAGPEIWEGHR